MWRMHRITANEPLRLFDNAAVRRIELAAARSLPPHALMQRAGLAIARLARALAPHARTIWLACGPGNNGGDGLEAAARLQQWGARPRVTWLGNEARCPPDARSAFKRAREAGVTFSDNPPEALGPDDLCIDALLGIGATRAPEGRMAALVASLNASVALTLSVDIPTGLNPETGTILSGTSGEAMAAAHGCHVTAQHTLTLLACKPGLFMAQGRDAAGSIWLNDLGTGALDEPACAQLNAAPERRQWMHASHKGSHGDVAIVGGEGLAKRGMGMTGAALLAAQAALHGGAGRVLVNFLDDDADRWLASQPELMARHFTALPLRTLTVVCGCGGGEAIREILPAVLAQAPRLVLDADALNAIAADPGLRTQLGHRGARQQATVLTPHPLEAARLLGTTATAVQADRLAAGRALAHALACTVVLKGSGTVVASPTHIPVINPTGSGRLGTAGTGDVLAGLIGAWLATGIDTFEAACAAVHQHGSCADAWPTTRALTAGALARQLTA